MYGVEPVQPIDRVATIPGWMRPEDADKLYELAATTRGPILEIGTYHGRSAVLMALARADAGIDGHIYTIDVERASIAAAQTQARAHGVAETIVFIRGTSAAFVAAYPTLRPSLTFVDGDHARAGVEADLAALAPIVPERGVLLFHDFNDPLNDDPGRADIAVRPAVDGSWVARECDFGGTFGACGLYTRRTKPPPLSAPIVDLLPLAHPREQYLHRLRYPAGRAWRRLRGGPGARSPRRRR